jgi:thioredoxin-related protein
VALEALTQQSVLGGTWILTDKQHLQGPLYENGVPKLLSITGEANKTILTLTTGIGEKDTVEVEIFEPTKHYTQVSMTARGRQKKIQLSKASKKNLWIRQVNLSARDNVNQNAILIVDSLVVSEDGNHLSLIRHYDGEDTPGSNQDYVIAGTYERTTDKQLVRETTKENGVVWTVGLTWPQILERARKEKKYVFLDCYATWCGPCKTMDRDVFALNRVGETMNNKYLAVKVQMDTGIYDSSTIRFTYPIARQLEQQYNIQVLPSYLFFDESGQLVHKEVGSFKADEFVKILNKAISPDSQLYTQYREALAEKLPPSDLPALATRLAEPQYGELEMSKTLMRLYINKQFYPLSDQALLQRDQLEKILQYWGNVQSNDRIFKLFQNDPDKINRILGKKSGEDFAQQRIEDTIWQELVRPTVKRADSTMNTPDWKALKATITQKYGKYYAARPVLNTQVWWYNKHQQWEEYCNYLYQLVQTNKKVIPNQFNYYNNVAWQMFLYSNNKQQLEAALQWTQLSINQQITQGLEWLFLIPTYSTYGNLLYKLGREEEAVSYYQKMVIDHLPNNIQSQIWSNTINRMKQGLPTWKDREKWADE